MTEHDVSYIISSHLSKSYAYQSKNKCSGKVKLFVSNIWKDSLNFNHFVANCIYFTIIERICVERAFQKIRMKDRCVPYEKNGEIYSCKMDYIACKMMEELF